VRFGSVKSGRIPRAQKEDKVEKFQLSSREHGRRACRMPESES
jgi:hypothetical protein